MKNIQAEQNSVCFRLNALHLIVKGGKYCHFFYKRHVRVSAII